MPPPLPLHRFGIPGAPRVLWLHGWLGSGREGADLFAPWLSDYEFLCPDLPGHGEAPQLDFDPQRCLDAIAELAASCSCAIGYSLGGRLLMRAALQHPGAFRRLVLESAFLGYTQLEQRADRRELDAQRAADLRRDGLEAFCEHWYAQPMWAGFRAPRIGNADALAQALEAFSSGLQPNLRPWLRYTTCPILWLAGTRDTAYVQQAQGVRIFSTAEVALLDAGHNIHAQNPQAWRDAVLPFISQQEPTTP
jgi:2-succinyl-6-hydroxy-2,4-cyclohexadiene-1-carboxylate synthase